MRSEDELVRWGLHLLEAPEQFNRCSCSCSAPEPDATSNTSSEAATSTQSDEALALRLQEQFYLQDSKDPQIGDYFDPPHHQHNHQEHEQEEEHLCDDCAAERKLHEKAEERARGEGLMGNSSSRRDDYHHHKNHCYYAYDDRPGGSYNSHREGERHSGNSYPNSVENDRSYLSNSNEVDRSRNSYFNENDRGRSSYFSSSNENDEAIAAVLSEELQAQYDVEVGRRLTHMESIPHVPKINGEIPDPDAATLDHQRLLERLHVYGLTEHKIPGDGNCQFRALSDQYYRTPDHHMFVRKEVIKQLKQDPSLYEGYVPMRYNDYLKKMSKSGEWGDHVTLQAAADAYGMKICLITSFRDTCIIDIVPKRSKSDRVIFLSFWAEVHYNSVYPEGEAPVSYHIKKKRHWFSIFG